MSQDNYSLGQPDNWLGSEPLKNMSLNISGHVASMESQEQQLHTDHASNPQADD